MNDKKLKFKKLLLSYLFAVILTIVLVGPAHLFPQPHFMPLRFPHYLEMMPAFLGFSWPTTFKIYHYCLYSLATIGILNILGLLYPKLKQLAILSSSTGLILFSLMALFFFLVFIKINLLTAIIYGVYSLELLKVDFSTFKALRSK